MIKEEKYDRWLVLSKPSKERWLCLCRCGTEREVSSAHLIAGNSRSCGCLQKELVIKKNTTHGLSRKFRAEYDIWKAIWQRCTNPNHIGHRDYLERGIRVCDRWRGPKGFANFMTDMGPRPSQDLTIERKNSRGNYSPGNCSWQTRKVQARNTRRNKLVTFRGRTQCVSAWAEEVGLVVKALHYRLDAGWPVEKALTLPSAKKRS